IAYDGQEALDTIESFAPDILLLDLLMPGMGGIDFLEAYQKKSPKSVPKIIILSNLGDSKLVKQARALGADKYIVKAHTTPGQLSLIVKRMSKPSSPKTKKKSA